MPYIVITWFYPSHKADEIVKKYIEILPKYPPDPSLGEGIVTALKTVEQGVKQFTVYEAKEGKLVEAWNQLMKETAEYRNIEGFEATIELWATTADAFAAVGMKPPE